MPGCRGYLISLPFWLSKNGIIIEVEFKNQANKASKLKKPQPSWSRLCWDKMGAQPHWINKCQPTKARGRRMFMLQRRRWTQKLSELRSGNPWTRCFRVVLKEKREVWTQGLFSLTDITHHRKLGQKIRFFLTEGAQMKAQFKNYFILPHHVKKKKTKKKHLRETKLSTQHYPFQTLLKT